MAARSVGYHDSARPGSSSHPSDGDDHPLFGTRQKSFDRRRIAQQISLAFDIAIVKGIVHRILAKRYCLEPGAGNPPSLIFLGHSKDSLWRDDLTVANSHLFMVQMPNSPQPQLHTHGRSSS